MKYAVIHADADRRFPRIISQHSTFKAAERKRPGRKKNGAATFVIYREGGFDKSGAYPIDLEYGDRLFYNSDNKHSPGETLLACNVEIQLSKRDLGLHFVSGESIDGKFDEVKYA